MRLLFIIPTLGSGGAERVVTLLANAMVQKNEVSIFCLEHKTGNDYGLKDSVDIQSSNIVPRRGRKVLAVFDFILGFRKMKRQVARYIIEHKPDVVISFLPKADLVTYTLRKIGKYKWISSERNDPWARNLVERELLKWIYRKCDCLVCQTRIVQEYYMDAGIARTRIISNPIVSYTVSKDKSYQKQYGKFAIAIGRLDRQKNYEMLLDAFATAIKKSPYELKLLILGDGVLKEDLQNKINDLGLTDIVLLLGRKRNVQDYIAEADFFVMSSDYEGLPNALLEAMNGGLPVICTDIKTGAARDLIDDSNGYLIPVGDGREMTKALVNMMALSDKERRQMGKTSHKKVANQGMDIIIHEWEKLILEQVER